MKFSIRASTLLLLQGVSGIDAMMNWNDQKAYVFKDHYFYRMDINSNRPDPGYPKPIQGSWSGLPFNRIDAAINWQNGKAYFFSGTQYARYDLKADRMDPGYPKLIQPNWNLPFKTVDAAMYWGNNNAYFFNNATGSYVRYKLGASAPDAGYPQYTSAKWGGIPYSQIGATAVWKNKAYVAGLSDNFVRLQMPSARMDYGFPQKLTALPAVASQTPPPAPPPPAPAYRTVPAPTAPPSVASVNNSKINGTLTYISQDTYGRTFYNPWNNVRVDLYKSGPYYNRNFVNLKAKGYTENQAMGELLNREDLWDFVVSTNTKPAQLQSNQYGTSYSWFGFVSLKPGLYRVKIEGYPTLTRWVSFSAGNQSLAVKLEHR